MVNAGKIRQVILIIFPWLMIIVLGLKPQSMRIQQSLETLQQSDNSTLIFLEEIQTLQRWEPWRTELWRMGALAAWGSSEFCLAADQFSSLARQASLTAEEQWQQVDSLFRCGSRDEAINAWREFLNNPHITADDLLLASNALVEFSANDLFQELASVWNLRFPQDANGWIYTARAFALSDPVEARTALLQAFSLNPSLQTQWQDLLLAFDSGEEEPAYRMVLIGQALAAHGDWHTAEQAFRQALDLEPYYADAWALLGEAIDQNGRDGYVALSNARILAPHAALTWSALSSHWRRNQRYDLALVYIDALIATQPDDPLWWSERGAILFEAGDPTEAFQAYQRATEIDPQNSEAWFNLAAFCVGNQIDLEQTGLYAARRAVLLDQRNPHAQDVLGQAYSLLQDQDTARRFYQNALALDPNFAPSLLHLGELEFNIGNLQQAYLLLQSAESQSTNNQVANQAAELLERYFGVP